MAGGALGIIAGRGELPRLVAEAEAARGRAPLIVTFADFSPAWASGFGHARVPYEKPGALFAALRGAGCGRICFAGAMDRPRLNPLRFDAAALRLAPRALALLRKGDDEMLRGFAAMLEDEGFTLIAAQDLLPKATETAGPLSARPPTDAERADAARARGIVAALGAVDVGQAAAAAEGLCLGVEAIAGTDVLLSQIGSLPAARRPKPPSGVLYKGPKPGQDRRMDLPAIGPQTMRGAAAAGLTGVCIAAEGVLILSREETIAEADRLGLALWAEEET